MMLSIRFRAKAFARVLTAAGVVWLWGSAPRVLTAQEAVFAPASLPVSSLAFPAITQHRTTTTPVLPYTAAEWKHGVYLYGMQAAANQPPDIAIYPKDSIIAETAKQAIQWIRTLMANGVSGLQGDPYSLLYVTSGQDSVARRLFAKRLATSGLTLTDAAFALSTAVQAFADADRPARLPIAEAYMTRLDALPKGPSRTGVSMWQFDAHRALSRAYFLTGNTQATIKHAQQAIALIPELFFSSRMAFYFGGDMYFTLADLLLATGDSARLKSIDQQLLAWSVAPDSLIAADVSFMRLSHDYTNTMHRMMDRVRMLGTFAPPVRGTSWLNVADTGGHEMRLDDGVVRIIGVGAQQQALTMLPAFERLAAKFASGFQPVYLMLTMGFWGTEFVTPAQESAHLRQYFTLSWPTHIPVAIWAGEKVRTHDGGLLPMPSPTVQRFKAGVPLCAIVDQQGRIRRFFSGAVFGREEEEQAAAVIRMLLKEQVHEARMLGGHS